MLKRSVISFAISALCGLVVYLVLELVVCVMLGQEEFSVLTPEFRALFPSEAIAMEVSVLLHGLIGAAFSAAAFIYERVEIGFIFQNVIYFLLTGVVWIPIALVVWQLYRYPSALIGTLIGFLVSYVVMSIIGYRMTKREIAQINEHLAMEEKK